MTIRALAFAASLGLAGCAAADQMSERPAEESYGFQEPGETAAIGGSTAPAKKPSRHAKPIDIAKVVHRKPLEKASRQRLAS